MENAVTTVDFPTGSQFTGTIVHGRMEGKGEYTFPSGTKYIGEFKDGMFNGEGTLHFPNGGCFEAEWTNGQALGQGFGGKYTFKDNLKYQEDQWDYSKPPDRRFHSEICYGMQPAGLTQMTDHNTPVEIPLGWYDCGDGLYSPAKRVIYDYQHKFLRNADTDEHNWITKTCRKGVTGKEK